MNFLAYPSYKTSGVGWLGDVPSHWSVLRFKTILRERNERSLTGEEELLSVSAYTGVSPRSLIVGDGDHLSRAESLVGYKQCFPNDLVVNIMLAWNRGLGVSQHAGIVSPAYCVFALSSNVDPRFLNYLSRSNEYTNYFKAFSSGVIDSRLRIYPDIFGALYCGLPPLSEQISIGAFLDREAARIDELVEEQRRLVALLKEKRQGIVSHAVTKGLDPEARTHDSGIAWLGEVPAHWTVTNAGRYLRILSGFAFPSEGFSTDPKNVRLLRGVNVGVGRIRWDETVYWPRSEGDSLSAFELSDGEIVIGMDRPWIAEGVRIAKLSTADLPCLLLQRVAALRPTERLDPDYLHFILSSPAFVDYFTPDMTGVSVPHLSPGQISRFPIPLPPLEEQRAIVAYLRARLNEADKLISAAEHAIALLEERRSALISAAVTGKIDVRGATQVLTFPVDRIGARGLIASEIIERSARQASFGRVKLQKIAYLTEAHVGVSELKGAYIREAAGPLDRDMVREMEREAGTVAGIRTYQPEGPGTAVTYLLGDRSGTHRTKLAELLGGDRIAKLDKLIDDIATIDTKGAEAVATLYAVWNDALIDGETPTDTENVLAVLTEWHPEKKEKFRMDELHTWLGWMRRHGLVPRGDGPKTSTGRLFA